MRFLQKYTNMKFMNLTGEWQKPNLGPGAGGGGLFLGILGGGVPTGSSNPDPISDQKMSFSTPVFRPDL